MKGKIPIKRVYEKPAKSDGYRILIDRLWPRGLSKESARVDWWIKEIAPTTELRQWFGHDPAKWVDFQKRYMAEIRANKETLQLLRDKIEATEVVTLVYAAKDEIHNDAVVLSKLLSA